MIFFRRNHLKSCLRWQFEIYTHPIHEKTYLIDQFLARSRNSFHMNIPMIPLFETKFFHDPEHPLHGVIRIFKYARAKEQALNIIPTVKVHRDFDNLIYCKSGTLHIIASTAD